MILCSIFCIQQVFFSFGVGGLWAQDNSDQPGDPIVEVDVPQQLVGAEILGKMGFDAKCAACHGTNAAGVQGSGPPLVHKIYEPGHHGDMSFFLAVRRGTRSHHWRFGDMPPVEGLTESDVANIVAYVRALQRENGIN